MPRAMRKDRAPAACFTAWGSPGGPQPGGLGEWCGPLRQEYNSRGGSAVPGLNKRPRYSCAGPSWGYVHKSAGSLRPVARQSQSPLKGRARLAPRPLQMRECAAVSTIPVTSTNMQENSTMSMTRPIVRSPIYKHAPAAVGHSCGLAET
jgi:hypothetical protein